MSKFVKVMYGTTSGAKSDFEYKIGEVNVSNNWNPNADSGKEFGGFNYCDEKCILRWLHRGDTIYDVEVPEDASNNVPYYKISGLENMNKINITCIPWITFSNFKDAIDFNKKNSKPKICWGKYYLEDNRYLIDISLLVNHAFQDGYHMGLFFNNLQQNIYNLKVNKNLVKVRQDIC